MDCAASLAGRRRSRARKLRTKGCKDFPSIYKLIYWGTLIVFIVPNYSSTVKLSLRHHCQTGGVSHVSGSAFFSLQKCNCTLTAVLLLQRRKILATFVLSFLARLRRRPARLAAQSIGSVTYHNLLHTQPDRRPGGGRVGGRGPCGSMRPSCGADHTAVRKSGTRAVC